MGLKKADTTSYRRLLTRGDSTFSDAENIKQYPASNKARLMGPELLSSYSFLHYNHKYDWLRLTLDEIVDAYQKLYGPTAWESDCESMDEDSDQGEGGSRWWWWWWRGSERGGDGWAGVRVRG